MYLSGIDISHFNGAIDWRTASTTVAFAFAKATQSTGYTDPRFHDNWSAMQDAGIPRGAYHFFDPARDAAAQADHFLNTVHPVAGDLPPVLDIETLTGAHPAAAVTGIHTWLAHVQAATARPPLVYSTASFWQQLGNPPNPQNCPLWVAHYGVPAPRIPPRWAAWTFWQFTQTGACPGIHGHVDLDRFYGSAADLQSLCQTATSEPLPTP